MYLPSYVEEPLNSKVIKSFVPKLRSRYVFFVFRDFYVLCIYVMNILMYVSHIAVSGYGTPGIPQNWNLTLKLSLVVICFFFVCLFVWGLGGWGREILPPGKVHHQRIPSPAKWVGMRVCKFGLVSLFNGISNLVVYLMPKPSL